MNRGGGGPSAESASGGVYRKDARVMCENNLCANVSSGTEAPEMNSTRRYVRVKERRYNKKKIRQIKGLAESQSSRRPSDIAYRGKGSQPPARPLSVYVHTNVASANSKRSKHQTQSGLRFIPHQIQGQPQSGPGRPPKPGDQRGPPVAPAQSVNTSSWIWLLNQLKWCEGTVSRKQRAGLQGRRWLVSEPTIG